MPDEHPEAPLAPAAPSVPPAEPAPEPVATAPIEQPAPTPTFRLAEVLSVGLELPDQYPLLVLGETEGSRRELAFPVGLAEGVALAHALRRLETPRPLTHELFASVLNTLKVDVVAVRLVGRSGGTYLAELDLTGPQGRRVLPCRPTDAITLALRQAVRAPILIDERLLAGPDDLAPS